MPRRGRIRLERPGRIEQPNCWETAGSRPPKSDRRGVLRRRDVRRHFKNIAGEMVDPVHQTAAAVMKSGADIIDDGSSSTVR